MAPLVFHLFLSMAHKFADRWLIFKMLRTGRLSGLHEKICFALFYRRGVHLLSDS